MKGLHRFAMSKREMRAAMAEQDRRIAFLEGETDSLAGRLETRTNELARALHALEAEKGRVTVAQVGTRDTSAMEDQSTEPIDVRTLREQFANVEPKRQPPVVSVVKPIPPREPSLKLRFPTAAGQVIRASGDHRATA